MKGLVLQSGDLQTVVSHDGDDVGLVQGRDYVQLSWEDAIRLRDWLQLAIQERTERLHSEVPATTGDGSA